MSLSNQKHKLSQNRSTCSPVTVTTHQVIFKVFPPDFHNNWQKEASSFVIGHMNGKTAFSVCCFIKSKLYFSFIMNISILKRCFILLICGHVSTSSTWNSWWAFHWMRPRAAATPKGRGQWSRWKITTSGVWLPRHSAWESGFCQSIKVPSCVIILISWQMSHLFSLLQNPL